jgi:hypothetical protein
LNMPLLETVDYEVFLINPFPAVFHEKKFIFMQPSSKFLVIDRNRMHYVMFTEEQHNRFVVMKKDIYLCKQKVPILMTHIHDNCEIKIFLKETKNLECDKRIISLDNGHFIQLKNSNSWLFSMPKPEVLTITCRNSKAPVDVYLSGVESISINGECKAYSFSSILIPSQTFVSNDTFEFIPHFNLAQDCCDEILKTTEEFAKPLELDRAYNKITLHVQDLNIASHKLDNIVKLTDDLERKQTTDGYIRRFSFLTYFLCAITEFIRNSETLAVARSL